MQIIDGKLVAAKTREQIAKEVAELKSKGYDREIGLAVIFVGNNPASEVYVRNKIKACEEVGIKSYLCKLPEESTFEDVADTIEQLNQNPDVSGMILQLPIPKHLDENKLIDLIHPDKDVDGCTAAQKGRLWTGRDSLIACTPYGVMKLIQYVAAVGMSILLVVQLFTIIGTQMSTGEATTVIKYPLWLMNLGVFIGVVLIVIIGILKIIDALKYFKKDAQGVDHEKIY